MKICIITPDFVGPVNNGGIGTFCFNLAHLCVSLGHTVDVLFTGFTENKNISWSDFYKEKHKINYISLENLSKTFDFPINNGYWFIKRSMEIANWLKYKHYDVCIFQDWHGNGLVPFQAKRSGIAFHNTQLVLLLHSSALWHREGMNELPVHWVEEMQLNYAESYGGKGADYVVSPSKYMFEWCKDNGWDFGNNLKVIPYPIYTENHFDVAVKKWNLKDIIFFGRLETRKGLEIFVEALKNIYRQLNVENKISIHFLGKFGNTQFGYSLDYLNQASQLLHDKFEFIIKDGLSQPEANEYLLLHNDSIVFAPSLHDNLPYSVIELAVLNLNVVTTKVGGITEIFTPNQFVIEPTVNGVKNALIDILGDKYERPQPIYSQEHASQTWKVFLEDIYDQLLISSNGLVLKTSKIKEHPSISVCIPYFNAHEYLEDCLQSLCDQTFVDFEVIVVDDGSTLNDSKEIFGLLAKKYKGKQWKWNFFSKENGGVGHTRNFAASKAKGPYLVFMDADNIATPEMLFTMFAAILRGYADCLTTYMTAFKHGNAPNVIEYGYTPTGGDITSGLVANVYGDANCIIKRETFNALGGFGTDKTTSYEDYELFVKLTYHGYKLDVIPSFLFYYRHLNTGFSRVTNKNKNHLRAISPILSALPVWNRRFIVFSLGTVDYLSNKENYYREELNKWRLEAETQKQRVVELEKSMHVSEQLEIKNIGFVEKALNSMHVSEQLEIKNIGFVEKALLKIKSRKQENIDCKIIERSGLFDKEWYLKNYPDVVEIGLDPVIHFLRHGWKEGRKPSKDFDTLQYLANYPDVKRSKINPLLHFIVHGASEKRKN